MAILHNIILLITALIAAGFDLWRGRIPNWLTYPALLLGLALQAQQGRLGGALLGVVVAGGLFLVVWLAGKIGGGDVKLMAALGALAGWPRVLDILFFTGLSGGVIAVFVLAFQRRSPEEAGKSWRERRMPYGTAIAAGTILAEVLGIGLSNTMGTI
jgi:Flp pilus assembly protein protease CpaA